MQILLGFRVNRGEPLHSTMQVLRKCWLHTLRVSQELAIHETSKERVRKLGELVLEDLRMRDLQAGLSLSLQDLETEGLQTCGHPAASIMLPEILGV